MARDPATAKGFCPHCGLPLDENEIANRECDNCGFKIDPEVARRKKHHPEQLGDPGWEP